MSRIRTDSPTTQTCVKKNVVLKHESLNRRDNFTALLRGIYKIPESPPPQNSKAFEEERKRKVIFKSTFFIIFDMKSDVLIILIKYFFNKKSILGIIKLM